MSDATNLLTDEQEQRLPDPRRRRPCSVTLLSGLVLIFAAIYLIRFGQTINNWNFLRELLPFSPVYLAVSGIFWGGAGLLVAGLTFRGWPGMRWLLPVSLAAYSLYYWLDRLLMPGDPGRNFNWIFAAMLNLLMAGWIAWILTRSKARHFFEETDERRTQNRTPA